MTPTEIEIIDAATKHSKQFDSDYQDQSYSDFYEGAQWAISLQPEWVSVTERLPEIGQQVLTINDKRYKLCKYVTYHKDSIGYSEGRRDCWFEVVELNTCLRINNVTDWYCIPQPPTK